MRRVRDAGVTLVELMVVIVIIGVLAAGAVIATSTESTGEAAREVTAILSMARRQAVTGGPVRPGVLANMPAPGEPEHGARAQVEVTTDDGRNVLDLYNLVENPDDTYVWARTARISLPSGVYVYGVSDSAAIDGGGALPAELGETGSAVTYFYPDGRAQAQTWWLQTRTESAHAAKFRVIVMPLSGVPQTIKGW